MASVSELSGQSVSGQMNGWRSGKVASREIVKLHREFGVWIGSLCHIVGF